MKDIQKIFTLGSSMSFPVICIWIMFQRKILSNVEMGNVSSPLFDAISQFTTSKYIFFCLFVVGIHSAWASLPVWGLSLLAEC